METRLTHHVLPLSAFRCKESTRFSDKICNHNSYIQEFNQTCTQQINDMSSDKGRGKNQHVKGERVIINNYNKSIMNKSISSPNPYQSSLATAFFALKPELFGRI